MIIYDTKFIHDWNTREGQKEGKLNCSHFTTIRHDSAKYNPQTIHRIWNNGGKGVHEKQLGYSVVINKVPFRFKELERFDWICRLDTGYGWQETKQIIQRMYKEGVTDETIFCIVLFRYLTKAEIERMTEKLKADNQMTIPLT